MDNLQKIDKTLLNFINYETQKALDFSSLTPEEFSKRFEKYKENTRQSAFENKIKLSTLDYDNEKQIFLNSLNSKNTKSSYERYINLAEQYACSIGQSILEFSPKDADSFIYSLKNAPATINLIIASVSSFFTFLERRYNFIENPFRHTKARPKKTTSKKGLYPTKNEVDYIIENMSDKTLSVIVYIMAYRGLRVGAFNTLKIKESRFSCISKGKEYKGTFSDEIIKRIKEARLNLYSPFADLDTVSLKSKIKYEVEKMFLNGKINSPYSSHDFRHFFASTEYMKDKDIYRVSKLLNHSNISVTQNYLQSIDVIL